MITIQYLIPPVSFNGNPILLFLKSDNYKIVNGNYSQNWLTVTPLTNYPHNATFQFNTLGTTLTFTFKNTPNTSGTELPVRLPGETEFNYCVRLKASFLKNYIIASNFDISISPSGANHVVIFSARDFGPKYNFTSPVSVGVLPSAGFVFVAAGLGISPVFRDNFRLLVQIRRNGEIKGEELLTVDELGHARIDISDYFNFESLLGFNGTQAIAPNYSALQSLDFAVAEVYGEPPAVYDFTLYEGYKVIPGKYLDNDFRYRYQSNISNWGLYRTSHIHTNKFLTSHPGHKVTYRKSYEKLTFLAFGTVDVLLNIYYTDNTWTTINLGQVVAADFMIYEINASPESLGIINVDPLKTVSKFSITLSVGGLVNDTFVFEYCHDKPLWFAQYAYIGQKGNWEFFTTTGGQSVLSSTNQEHFVPAEASNVFSHIQNKKITKSESKLSIVGRTGIVDRNDILPFTELLESPIAFEIIDGKLHSIAIESGAPLINENVENENLHAFEFSYTRDKSPMRSIFCDDQFPDYTNTLPDTLVSCWGQLPPIPSLNEIQDDAGNPITDDNLNSLLTD